MIYRMPEGCKLTLRDAIIAQRQRHGDDRETVTIYESGSGRPRDEDDGGERPLLAVEVDEDQNGFTRFLVGNSLTGEPEITCWDDREVTKDEENWDGEDYRLAAAVLGGRYADHLSELLPIWGDDL